MGDAATTAGAFTEIFANKWGAPDGVIDPYSSVTYPGSVAPQVVQVSPTGTTSPGTGTQVTIAGNYFSAFSAGQVPTVDFGSTPATNVHVNWDGQLTADAPPDPLGGRPTPWPSPSPHRPGRRMPAWARPPMRSATAPPQRHR